MTTIYNGSTTCVTCGDLLSPAYATYSNECWDCSESRHAAHVKKRMSP